MAHLPPLVGPQEIPEFIESGSRVFIQGAAMTPLALIDAMVQGERLSRVETIHIHTEGRAPYVEEPHVGRFDPKTFFVAKNTREAVNAGRADYIPMFLSDIPLLFRQGILPLDVALIHVSPPDQYGFCSLGASVDVTLAAVQSAKRVIAQINPKAPRVHGEGFIHVDKITAAMEVETPLVEHQVDEPSEIERQIGRHVASLIADGATLQMGIGGVPNAVLQELRSHKKLGVHTEMFSDGLIDLVERGVVTGEMKKTLPRRIVASFVLGTKKVFDFINDNPIIEMRDAAYTNDTAVIRNNPKVTAINSALEVDLTGQICADTIGYLQYSGVGGQMDFMRGAALSEGGRPIIALPSTTNSGVSRITPLLKEGAAITTTRAHVRFVVTEYGVADLFGKSLRERAKALIAIAHPDHRERLERSVREGGARRPHR